MKIFFLGRYNQSEYLSGPEKVAKRIYAESVKDYESVFIEYFFDGREFGFSKKLFGREKIKSVGSLKIFRFGIISLLFFFTEGKTGGNSHNYI